MLNLGNKIKEIFDSKGITVVEFAKRINTSRENVYAIFHRVSIDTYLLARICDVLDYNFFELVTPEKFKQGKQEEVNTLIKQLEVYETEIKYLKEINTLKDKLSDQEEKDDQDIDEKE